MKFHINIEARPTVCSEIIIVEVHLLNFDTPLEFE